MLSWKDYSFVKVCVPLTISSKCIILSIFSCRFKLAVMNDLSTVGSLSITFPIKDY